jgi:hypothetical protein
MEPMKSLLRLVVVFVVLLVAGGIAGYIYLDTIARGAIEVAGTKVLGVKTTVSDVSIGLLSGEASLGGLDVANPEGCKGPSFLKLDTGAIAVTPKSLLEPVVRIPTIDLSGIAIDFEQRIGGDSNVDVILANAKKFAGSSGQAGGGGTDTGSGKKFVVDTLTITDITVTARTTGMPIAEKGIEIKVPKIVLKDIGSAGSDPVGLEQLTGMVVQAVMQAVMEASGGQLPEIFAQGITNGIRDLGDAFTSKLAVDLGKGLHDVGGQIGQGVGKAVEEGAKGLGKGVEDAAKGLGDAVDGLFKKK